MGRIGLLTGLNNCMLCTDWKQNSDTCLGTSEDLYGVRNKVPGKEWYKDIITISFQKVLLI